MATDKPRCFKQLSLIAYKVLCRTGLFYNFIVAKRTEKLGAVALIRTEMQFLRAKRLDEVQTRIDKNRTKFGHSHKAEKLRRNADKYRTTLDHTQKARWEPLSPFKQVVH